MIEQRTQQFLLAHLRKHFNDIERQIVVLKRGVACMYILADPAEDPYYFNLLNSRRTTLRKLNAEKRKTVAAIKSLKKMEISDTSSDVFIDFLSWATGVKHAARK